MQQLNKNLFAEKLDHRLEDKTFDELINALVDDPATQGHEPEHICQLDPRDGAMVIYAGKRAERPDLTKPSPGTQNDAAAFCPICEGKLTQVVDCAPLSEGFTFISQNLFPIAMPHNYRPEEAARKSLYLDSSHNGRAVFGAHLLQWSSSIHQMDWHNMPAEDIKTNLYRLAVLEKSLLSGGKDFMPPSNFDDNLFGFTSIIKNFGAKAGASLAHGHQQIAFSNIMPQQAYNNLQFYARHNRSLAKYLLTENPEKLTIEENNTAKIVVPYFMRRPSNILILPVTNANYLHQLSREELQGLAKNIQKVIRGLNIKFESVNKEMSFNLAFHTGPGCTLYVEFYPILQASGGFERVGLWICQESPERATQEMRSIFETLNQNKNKKQKKK